MNVRIKYFASIREVLGVGGELVQTQALSVSALRDELFARGGTYSQALERTRHIRAALNQCLVEEDALLSEGCEVAFFPPVTGG